MLPCLCRALYLLYMCARMEDGVCFADQCGSQRRAGLIWVMDGSSCHQLLRLHADMIANLGT